MTAVRHARCGTDLALTGQRVFGEATCGGKGDKRCDPLGQIIPGVFDLFIENVSIRIGVGAQLQERHKNAKRTEFLQL